MDDDLNRRDPGPSSPGFRWPSVTSLIAIVLSLSALLVSVFEVSAIRDEGRYQVWPYVALEMGYSAEGYMLRISNKGVGPAKIRDLAFYLDGKRYFDLDTMIRDTLGEADAFSYDLYQSNNPLGSVLSADETSVLFAVPWEDRTRRLSKAWAERLSLETCYCSVYEECWSTTLEEGEPREREVCRPPE